MEQMQIFESPEFGRVRTQTVNGKPYFCGADVARALGYSKPQNAIAAHCKGALKRGTPTAGGVQELSFIPEGDVYRLICCSNLPGAERFEAWVFDEVLPGIRKDGGYIATTPEMTEKEILARAVLIGQRTIEEQKQRIAELDSKIEEDKPKVIFADTVSASKNSILIRDFAKMLHQAGIEIGEKRLFQWMRDHGYMTKTDYNRNMPTQRSMDIGLFEIKETTITGADGVIFTTRTPKITGKGQVYFTEKLR